MVITIRHLAHIATHIAAHIENHRQCVPPWRLAADEITARHGRHYGSSPTTLRLVFLDIFAFSLRHPKIPIPVTSRRYRFVALNEMGRMMVER